MKKTWRKTKVQGLLVHQNGGYYGRLYLGGKEKWLSLHTTVLEVAKAKLAEEKKAVAAARKSGWEPQAGIVRMQTAVDSFEAGLALRVDIKESTRKFYRWTLKSILKTWPELPLLDIRHVGEDLCKTWAKNFSNNFSANYYNNAVLVLGEIFEQGIRSGTIYKNPTANLGLKRKTPKQLCLPSKEQFHQVVAAVRNGQHRTSGHAADLIEFLAYTGCRISEARKITWADCDFNPETILVKGDAETGTKNWKIRTIPMIEAAKMLLIRIKENRSEVKNSDPVLQVGDVRGSLEKAGEVLKISGVSHHDFRHLFATTCIEAGVDIPTISRWLGHSDGGTLAMKTYGHLRDQHSKESAKKVSFK